MLLLHSCAHCQPSGTRHTFSPQVHSQLKKLLSSVAWFGCSAVNRVNSGTFCTWFIRCFVQRRRGSLRASGFPYCGTAVETVLHLVIQLAVLLLLLSEGRPRNGQQDCLLSLLKCLAVPSCHIHISCNRQKNLQPIAAGRAEMGTSKNTRISTRPWYLLLASGEVYSLQ